MTQTAVASADLTALSSEHPIRLLLVDGQTLVRQGLAALLQAECGIDVIASEASIQEAVSLNKAGHAPGALQLDVIVTDVDLPGTRASDVVTRLRQTFGPVPILVLSSIDNVGVVRRALAAGAAGYLLKSATTGELLTAIHALYRGDTFLDPSLAAALTQTGPPVERDPATLRLDQLTASERHVLHLLALGLTNAEAARHLKVSVRTVESRRARIGQELGSRRRADLVRAAQHLGLA